LVAGLGLLGSEVAPLLAAVGIGALLLVDCGTVDFTNIYRQRLYERKDVYQAKVDVVARRLGGTGTSVEASRLTIPTVSGNARHILQALALLDGLVARASLVIGALDSFSGRAVLQALCLARRVAFLSVALDEEQGRLFLNVPDRPNCYACGRPLNAEMDRGVCTIAPIELPPIVGGLAFRLAMDFFHNRCTAARDVQLYADDLSIAEQQLGDSDEQCDLCGPHGVVRGAEDHLHERIFRWLIGEP